MFLHMCNSDIFSFRKLIELTVKIENADIRYILLILFHIFSNGDSQQGKNLLGRNSLFTYFVAGAPDN